MNKKRIYSPTFIYDSGMPPELNLAAAIIHRAANDVKELNKGRSPTYLCNKYELKQFFLSRWCSMLLCVSDISTDNLLKEVGF